MIKNNKYLWIIVSLVLVFLFVSFSLNESIIKGPYLQNVTTNSIVVMWETNNNSLGTVEYWVKGSNDISSAKDKKEVKIHEIKIPLESDTNYEYKVKVGSVESEVHGFVSAPQKEKEFYFAAYGDTRSHPKIAKVIGDLIWKQKPAFVIHTGDFNRDGVRYRLWDKEFFSPEKNMLADTPLFPVFGNHERDGKLYYDFFSTPTNSGNEDWYSFDYSNVHFTILNTEKDCIKGSEQLKWFEKELSEAKQFWKIVVIHRPIFSSCVNSQGRELTELRDILLPLIEKYKVDIVINGHAHQYERSKKDGICYITTAGGGAPLYEMDTKNNPYSVVAKMVHHYCIVSIKENILNLKVYDIENQLIDEDNITKVKK